MLLILNSNLIEGKLLVTTCFQHGGLFIFFITCPAQKGFMFCASGSLVDFT